MMMNDKRCSEEDYINFLIGTPKVYTCTEAARVQPDKVKPPAHDSLTRLLQQEEMSSEMLWKEAESFVNKEEGILVIDDSTLDKPYAKKMDLVSYHWSGKHHRIVKGISLISMIWTDGDIHIPCDYCVYDKEEGLTKNDHFMDMIEMAKNRGFKPQCVGFDSWYASLENLKYIRNLEWIWLTRLEVNRQVNSDNTKNKPLSETVINEEGTIVHLKGYGMVKVFKIVSKKGDIGYWATNKLDMNVMECLSLGEKTWGIEEYHREIKQYCGVERCQARSRKAQINHIGLSIRACLRLIVKSYNWGKSLFEIKHNIIRNALKHYLSNPDVTLQRSTA
jgi:putative transposase